MPEALEDALTRTLSEAAEAAPGQPPGLVHEVDVRFRRRRRRTYAAVAGVAVFAVIGGSALAAGVVANRGPGPSTVGIPAATGGATPPIAEVWPNAVRHVSAKLADGRKYQTEVMLDDHRLLVTTNASFENANELWVLDLDTEQAHRIAKLPPPHAGRETFASHFTVGAGHVVWWDTYVEDGKGYTRIWKVVLTGGEPKLVATVPQLLGGGSQSGDRLQVGSDGHVYWSGALMNQSARGVWKLPLAGGEPRKVAGSDGYHLVIWPWIGSPAVNHGEDGSVIDGPDSPGFVAYQKLRNLKTGEERDAVPADKGELWSCAITWCVGGADPPTQARHRDGSHQRTLPVAGMGEATDWMAYDRFVTLTDFDNDMKQYLFDLQTGKQGEFGIPVEKDGEGGTSATGAGVGTWDSRFISWSIDGGKTLWVLDLAAIK